MALIFAANKAASACFRGLRKSTCPKTHWPTFSRPLSCPSSASSFHSPSSIFRTLWTTETLVQNQHEQERPQHQDQQVKYFSVDYTASDGDDATDPSGVTRSYKSRPMKEFFTEYDEKFDAKLEELEVQKRDSMKNWDIVGATFLERQQVIIEEPHPVEVAYNDLRDELDEKYNVPLETVMEGYDAYQEIREEAESLVQKQVAAIESGEVVDEEEMRKKIYAQYAGSDKGERIIEEYDLMTRKDPPRITQADMDDDRRSLNRKLDERLFLIVKKDRKKYAWQFPQLVHVDPDPTQYHKGNLPGLRETAEQAMLKFAGDGLKGYFYSHAPQGFYYYPYDDPTNGSFGCSTTECDI